MKKKFLIGIDEVGRGPIAGPVTVAAAIFPSGFDMKLLHGIRDSKQLTEEKREEWYEKAKAWKRDGKMFYKVSFVSSGVIDRIRISKSIKLAIERCLKGVDHKGCEVRLDGLLYAPERFKYQKTIIKGDQKEKVIGLASVIAKVSRDRRMKRYALTFPGYGFETHKGYGTKKHYKSIRKLGLSTLHRKSYLSGLGK